MIFKKHNIWSLCVVILLPFAVYGASDLPGEFNTIIPVYPLAHVYNSKYSRDRVIVIFKSNDSYAKIHDYYVQTLSDKGWEKQVVKHKSDNKTVFVSKTHGFHVVLYGLVQVSEKPTGYIIEFQYPDGRE